MYTSYNEWRSEFFPSDPFQRVAIDVLRVDGLSDPNGFTYSRRGRELQHQQKKEHPDIDDQERERQSDLTSTPAAPSISTEPSSAPSTTLVFDKDFNDGVDLLFEISGSCTDCPDDILLLSDDTLDRRRLYQDRRQLDEEVESDSSPEEIIVSILTEKLLLTDSDLIVYDLNEVRQEVCPAELDLYLASATFDLKTPFVVNDVVELERAFVDSYNRLYTRYCDPAFRIVFSANCVNEEQILLSNELVSITNVTIVGDGDSDAVNSTRATRYTFEVEVVCRLS